MSFKKGEAMNKAQKIWFYFRLFRVYENGVVESAVKAFLFLFTKVYLKPRNISGGIIP